MTEYSSPSPGDGLSGSQRGRSSRKLVFPKNSPRMRKEEEKSVMSETSGLKNDSRGGKKERSRSKDADCRGHNSFSVGDEINATDLRNGDKEARGDKPRRRSESENHTSNQSFDVDFGESEIFKSEDLPKKKSRDKDKNREKPKASKEKQKSNRDLRSRDKERSQSHKEKSSRSRSKEMERSQSHRDRGHRDKEKRDKEGGHKDKEKKDKERGHRDKEKDKDKDHRKEKEKDHHRDKDKKRDRRKSLSAKVSPPPTRKSDDFDFDDDCSWATEQLDGKVEVPPLGQSSLKGVAPKHAPWFGSNADDLFRDAESTDDDAPEALLTTTPKVAKNSFSIPESPRDQYIKTQSSRFPESPRDKMGRPFSKTANEDDEGLNGTASTHSKSDHSDRTCLRRLSGSSHKAEMPSTKELLSTRDVSRRNRRHTMNHLEVIHSETEHSETESAASRRYRQSMDMSSSRRQQQIPVDDDGISDLDEDSSFSQSDADFDDLMPDGSDVRNGGRLSRSHSLNNSLHSSHHSGGLRGGSYLPNAVLESQSRRVRRPGEEANGGPRLRPSSRSRRTRSTGFHDDDTDNDADFSDRSGTDSIYSGASFFTGVDQNFTGAELMIKRKDKSTDRDLTENKNTGHRDGSPKRNNNQMMTEADLDYNSDWSQKIDDALKKNRMSRHGSDHHVANALATRRASGGAGHNGHNVMGRRGSMGENGKMNRRNSNGENGVMNRRGSNGGRRGVSSMKREMAKNIPQGPQGGGGDNSADARRSRWNMLRGGGK